MVQAWVGHFVSSIGYSLILVYISLLLVYIRRVTTTRRDGTKKPKKHKQQTNTITMVVEPLAPPAVWI